MRGKACGAHSALAREVNSVHVVLTRLEAEAARPESILNGSGASSEQRAGRDEKRRELANLVKDCAQVLRVLKEILEKYNALSDEARSVQKLWQKVRFGNGEMQDLDKIRSTLVTHTQAITLSLNLAGLKSQGRVERYMESHGDELKEIKTSLNWLTAKLQVEERSRGHGEKSILSSYNGDDKEVWKMFRRELLHMGFSSDALTRHKDTIKNYVIELGASGVLDEADPGPVEGKRLQDEIQNLDTVEIDSFAPSGIEFAGNEDLTEPTHEVESEDDSTNTLAIDPGDTNKNNPATNLRPIPGSLTNNINGWLRKNIINDDSMEEKDRDLPDLSEPRSELSSDTWLSMLSQSIEMQKAPITVADQLNGNRPQLAPDSNTALRSGSGSSGDPNDPIVPNRSGEKQGKRKEGGMLVKTEPGADASQGSSMTSLSTSSQERVKKMEMAAAVIV